MVMFSGMLLALFRVVVVVVVVEVMVTVVVMVVVVVVVVLGYVIYAGVVVTGV